MNRLEVYQDKKRLWRWRLRAPNGRIVADGAEGYQSRSNVLRAAKKNLSTPFTLEGK